MQFRAGDLGGIESSLSLHKNETTKAPLVEFVTATLDEILMQAHAPRYIDYMNFDVEGAEYDVLQGLSFDKYEFGSMTVEHNYETDKRESLHRLLAAKGYVRVRSGRWMTGMCIDAGPSIRQFSGLLFGGDELPLLVFQAYRTASRQLTHIESWSSFSRGKGSTSKKAGSDIRLSRSIGGAWGFAIFLPRKDDSTRVSGMPRK